MVNSASGRPLVMRSARVAASSPAIRSSSCCRSPTKVSDRLSTDRSSVSKILSRPQPARRTSSRKRPAAAGDIAIRIIEPSPNRQERAQRSVAAGRVPGADRTRIADLQRHCVQSGLEPCHFRASIFLCSSANAPCPSLYRLATRRTDTSQPNSYLSRQFPIAKAALMTTDPRFVLERLCADRGEDFDGLSRVLGRNPAYILLFVRRGVY